MANKEGYPWDCERDGMNVRDIAECPVVGLRKTHTETHNSETGREAEHEPHKNPRPTAPRRR